VGSSYPEVLRWDFHRRPLAHGSRRNLNYTSPKYLQLSDRITTALAEHYRNHPAVFAWQLDNEFNCHSSTSYAPSDAEAFRVWCRQKYGSIDALNDAWGTRFWSQVYDRFAQIDLPHPSATYLNPTHLLDESRFISDCVVRFARRQAEILRRANPRWLITHNCYFENIDGPELTSLLDFYSHDQYPLFYDQWTDYTHKLIQSRSHSRPFAILEQQSGPGGQQSYLHPTPRPGQIALWASQAIAHGANLMCYFTWRTCPFGAEQHWHGIVDHDNRDTAHLAEIRTLGTQMRELPDAFWQSTPEPFAAVVRDFDNETNDARINTYSSGARWASNQWQSALLQRGVTVDHVWLRSRCEPQERELSLIIAPHLRMLDESDVARLREFVERGATLILGAQTGIYDRNLHAHLSVRPCLARELAGVEVEAWSTLPSAANRTLESRNGTAIQSHTFVEALRCTSAEPIATWTDPDPLLHGQVAAAINTVGAGRVIYLGGCFDEAAIAKWLDLLPIPWRDGAPIDARCVERIVRRAPSGDRFECLLNHTSQTQHVTIHNDTIELPAWGWRVRQIERAEGGE
jgi:beta-galactosidase